MSHYTVLVINSDGIADVDEQLKDYDENIEVDRYVKYTKDELIKREKEYIKDYEKGTYAEYLKDKDAYRKKCSNNQSHLSYIENEFSKKLKWTDEQIYANAIKSYEDVGKDGEVYSTYNPLSKWDWYEIGGRWAGEFKLNPGGERIQEPNFSYGYTEDEKLEITTKGLVDQAYFGDIDWKGMRSVENYDNACRFWELYIDKEPAITEEDKELIKWCLYKESYYENKYKNKETYAKCMTNFTTYAVLKDGEWFAPGKMGYWGMSSEEDEEGLDWELNYYDKFLQDLSDDALLTIVDCHI